MKLTITLLGLIIMGSLAAQSQETATVAQQRAENHLSSGRYQDAINDFNLAIRLATQEGNAEVVKAAQKNGALAAFYQGGELQKENKHQEAVAMYEKGLAFNSSFFGNHVERASSLSQFSSRKKSFYAYLEAAEAAANGNQYAYAQDMLSKAEALKKSREQVIYDYYLARYHEIAGDYAEALAIYENMNGKKKWVKMAQARMDIMNRA
jgi:tetratricopeptide (TPR) repeat protein